MPEMIPVGNTGIQPDPLGSISKMMALRSSQLGIQQQQQNLQTGQYAQAAEQARATTEQLGAQQQQGVQSFFQNWDPTEHRADDGTTDLDSALQSPQFKGSGNAKPAIMQALLDIKNKQLTGKTALAGLNGALTSQFGTAMGSLAKDPDVRADKTDPVTGVNAGRAKVDQFIQNFSKLSPDAARVAQIYQPITQNAPPGKLAHGIESLQMMAQSASEQQGQQNPVAVNNAAGQIVNRERATGTLSAAPVVGATAPPSPLNPTTSDVAAKTATQGGAASGDNDRFNQISQDNQKGQSMVALSQQVGNLADQVRTGKLSKTWADQLAVLQQDNPSITSRQMLSKYAAQLKAMAESGASTDAERSTVEAGMPNPDSMDPAATKEAAQYVGGMGALRNARDQVASQYIQKNGSTAGLRAIDDAFMQHADPFVYTYKSLPAGPERQQFLLKKFGDGSKITNPGALQQFLDQQSVVKHYGG